MAAPDGSASYDFRRLPIPGALLRTDFPATFPFGRDAASSPIPTPSSSDVKDRVIHRRQTLSRCDDAQPLSRSDVPPSKIIKARPRHRFTARTMEKLIPTTASTSHHHVRRPQRRHTPVSECSRGGFHFIAASPVLLSQQPRLPHRVPSRDASKDLQLPLHPPSLASAETRHNNNYKLQQSTKLPRGHIRASKDYNGCPRSLLSLKSLFTPLFFFY